MGTGMTLEKTIGALQSIGWADGAQERGVQ